LAITIYLGQSSYARAARIILEGGWIDSPDKKMSYVHFEDDESSARSC
jgi:hypothetical protein